MKGDSSIVSLMNGISSDVGVVDGAYHVEVDRVPAKLVGLPNIQQLDIFYPSY